MPTRRMSAPGWGRCPTTAGAALDLLVQPLERVGAADLAAVGLGEREVGEQVVLGVGQQVRDRRDSAGGTRR